MHWYWPPLAVEKSHILPVALQSSLTANFEVLKTQVPDWQVGDSLYCMSFKPVSSQNVAPAQAPIPLTFAVKQSESAEQLKFGAGKQTPSLHPYVHGAP